MQPGPTDMLTLSGHYPPTRGQDSKDTADESHSSHTRSSAYPRPPDGYPSVFRPSNSLGPKPSFSGSDFTSKGSETASVVSVSYPPALVGQAADTRYYWQRIVPDSLACKLYILTVVVQTTIDLAIEGDLLVRFNDALDKGAVSQNPNLSAQKMPVYLGVFVLAHVFQFAMAVDAVYARNTLQFISLTIFNALFLAYAVIQIGEINSLGLLIPSKGISKIPIHILTTIIPIVISLAEIAYVCLGWKIYREFGWKVYKFLGANRKIKTMYANYQIFECLVKFDVFFWLGFSLQFIWLVLQKNDWEYYVTCAALPLSLLLLLEGHLAARYENKWMMATFMSGCVGALVYFIYKLVKVITHRNGPVFHSIAKSLSTFSVIAIILLVLTFVSAIVVMRNFGLGLKEALSRKRSDPSRQGQSSQSPLHRSASTNLNRMSIE